MVNKITKFPRFSEVFNERIANKQIPQNIERRAFTVSWIRKARNFFKETEKRAYTTASAELVINSVRVHSLKHYVYY